MTDISASLERLEGLRDRGTLTQDEFERQKAALLAPGPPSAPAIPLQSGTDRTPLYMAVGIAVLAAAAAGFGGMGFFGHQNSMASGSAPSSATRPAAASATAGVSPLAGVTSAAAGGGSVRASGTAGTASVNPMLGQWISDDSDGECPRVLLATPTRLVLTMFGHSDGEEGKVTYTVRSADTVEFTSVGGSSSGPHIVTIRDGHLETDRCRFHRG